MDNAKLSYLIDLVKARDYDRYLCTLYAPRKVQGAWFALLAFDAEIAAIPSQTTEEMTALIRYTWWREVIEQIYHKQTVREHPVAKALEDVVNEHQLPQHFFLQLIEARMADLDAMPFDSEEVRITYVDHVYGGLFTLMALCADEKADGEYCRLVGRLHATTLYVRHAMRDLEAGKYWFARERLEEAGLSVNTSLTFANESAFNLLKKLIEREVSYVDNIVNQLNIIGNSDVGRRKMMRVFEVYNEFFVNKINKLSFDVQALPNRNVYIQLKLLFLSLISRL